MRLEFENLEFREEKDLVKVIFLKYYHFHLRSKDLERIGNYKVEKNAIELEVTQDTDKDTISQAFNTLLSQGFSDLTGFFGRKAIYVHKHSNIPLIGNLGFGIVDRNTNALELKPITDCNLDCTFCSVDEGKSSKKITDFVVEAEYLIDETKKILEFKGVKTSIHINPHGEPLLYSNIIQLVKGLRELKNAGMIAMYTNGSLLTESLIDELASAGLDRLSISLHSLDEKKASELAGGHYPAKHVQNMISYAIANTKMEVILSPVYLAKINEADIEEIMKFGKAKNLSVTIQNFLNYKLGRNPGKEISFDKFFKKLDELQEKYDMNLRPDKDPRFVIEKTQKLPVPFKTGEIITAVIMCPGRYRNEMIAAAQERTIIVPDCKSAISAGQKIQLKIEKSKDNLFIGTIAKGKPGKPIEAKFGMRRR